MKNDSLQTVSRNFRQSCGAFFASDRKYLVLAFVYAAILLFANLGNEGMTAAQEGRTAIITRNMLLSGNYMDMTIPGGVLYEKPVGYYWMCVPLGHLFGITGEPMKCRVEWALRLPSALSAMVMLLAAAWIACRLYDIRTGALSVAVLGTMAYFLHLGRLAHIDMPLASAYTLAMVFLYTGYFRQWKAEKTIYGFYLCLAWAVLLKGPLPALLAGLVLLAMMIFCRHWTLWKEIRPVTGGILFLAAVLPWYIAENIRTDGGFFQEFIINQNIRRFTGVGSTYRNGKRMSFFYYFLKLFANALPWSVPGAAALLLYLKKLWKRPNLKIGTVYLLVWAGTGFLFFSFSALKRGDYLLPLYAPMAVLTARALVNFCSRGPGFPKCWRIVWLAVSLLLFAVPLAAVCGAADPLIAALENGSIRIMSRNDAQNTASILSFLRLHPFPVFSGVFLISALLAVIGFLCEKRRYFSILILFIIFNGMVYLAYYGVLMPRADLCRTVKPLIREAEKIIPPGEKITFLDFNTELIFFMNRPYEAQNPPETRFLFCDEKQAVQLERSGWLLRLRTPENHRYGTFLMENPSIR